MAAFLARIDAVNPRINAIVTLTAAPAIAAATAADQALARGDRVGSLHGVPIAHKDLQATAGVRTTFGSPIFRDYVPTEDAPLVTRLKRAGAIMIGKTNTPEFGAGSQTFNPVFGATLNPYDTTKTCGGSSGGAAAALACGMLPLADGTDMGGSLRNPAAFCGVVGMRPSAPPASSPVEGLSVEGPMGRNVADVALLLNALNDTRPETAGAPAIGSLSRDFAGVDVAWLTSIGDAPFERAVVEAFTAAGPIFEAIGCRVHETTLDLSAADAIFRTLRAKAFIDKHATTVNAHRSQVKETVLEEIRRGEQLTEAAVAAAERDCDALRRRVAAFMERYEFLVLPTTQVAPFDVSQPYVTSINGEAMTSYIDWMKSCYYISTIGHPAISVPCGFTPEGLPVGLQIVGRDRSDWATLQLAAAYEHARGPWKFPAI